MPPEGRTPAPPSESEVELPPAPTPISAPVRHKREALPRPLDGNESYGPKTKKHAFVH
jgi:hypothetical protein